MCVLHIPSLCFDLNILFTVHRLYQMLTHIYIFSATFKQHNIFYSIRKMRFSVFTEHHASLQYPVAYLGQFGSGECADAPEGTWMHSQRSHKLPSRQDGG